MKSFWTLIIFIVAHQAAFTNEEASGHLLLSPHSSFSSLDASSAASGNLSSHSNTITPVLQPSPTMTSLPSTLTSIAPTPSTKQKNRGTSSTSATSSTNGSVPFIMNPELARLFEQMKLLIEIENYFRIADFSFAALSFLILTILRLPSSSKFFVHKNLIFAVGMTDLFSGLLGSKHILPKIEAHKDVCAMKTILNYYWTLSMLAWMSVEAFNICLMLSEVFDTRSKLKKHILYTLFGYGTPAVITVFVVPLFWETEFSSSYLCQSFKDVWVVRGPTTAYLVINVLAFIYILGLTFKHILTSTKYKGSFKKFVGTIRSFLVLYPILGISYALHAFLDEDPIVFGWIYSVSSAFLAIIFFIFHVLLDSQVQEAFFKKFCKSRRSTNSRAATTRLSKLHTFTDSSPMQTRRNESGKKSRQISI